MHHGSGSAGSVATKAFFSRHNVRSLIVMLSLIFTVRWSVASPYEVPTPSMEPSIKVGDRVFGNHLAYRLRLPFTDITIASWGAPERGDIIIFKSQTESGINLVKRVVAIGGDTVRYRDGALFVNGKEQALDDADFDRAPLDDATDRPAFKHLYREELAGRPHWVLRDLDGRGFLRDWPAHGDYIVPEGSVFASGDNRDNSSDSRVFGSVPIADVYGKATRVIWSAYVPAGEWWPHLRVHRFLAAIDGMAG